MTDLPDLDIEFEIVDADHLEALRRRRGYGANPWAAGSRFILSHRLLGDETYVAGLRDVLEDFRARSLLILDEAHQAAPAGSGRYAIESQFTRALRDLSERFEHRLFLSATPHNGHSNSFTTLLELLDPQRFTRGVPVRAADLEPVMVRRLKSDLRALGEAFPERVVEAGHACAARALVADEVEAIRAQVRAWTTSGEIDAVITTGGTGLTGRDVTPEALEPLFDKRIEGFSVVFHTVSYQTIGLSTLQSRATAGIIDGVFVFCLPGSNGAVRDGWDKVIRWQLDSRHRPCNMVELMPRLKER